MSLSSAKQATRTLGRGKTKKDKAPAYPITRWGEGVEFAEGKADVDVGVGRGGGALTKGDGNCVIISVKGAAELARLLRTLLPYRCLSETWS